MRSKISRLFVVCLILPLLQILAPPQAAAQKPRPVKPEVNDPFTDPNSGPLPLGKVTQILGSVASRDYSRTKLIKALQNRGVDFDSSPDHLRAVREATPDEELFQLVKSKMRPYVPPPPPKGSISASCEPVECHVKLNGNMVDTKGGIAVFENLQPGETQLEFSREDYNDEKLNVTVEEGKQARAKVKLVLSKAGKFKADKIWLDKMWEALSAGDHGVGAQEISASGSATIYDASGKETHWGLIVKLAEATSTMELRLPSGTKPVFVLECHGDEDCKQQPLRKGTFGAGKPAIDPDIATVALREFRKYQLGSILKRLSSPDVQFRSATVNATDAHVLNFEASDQGFEVQLSPNFLIAQVTIRSKLGLGEGILIAYSDYQVLEKTHAKYPKKTVYRSGEKRGFSAELSWGK